MSNWFYLPGWEASPLPETLAGAVIPPRRWMIFEGQDRLSTEIVERLRSLDQEIILVRMGGHFIQVGASIYEIHPGQAEDYRALFAAQTASGHYFDRILHLWNAAPVEGSLDISFYSLIYLAQCLELYQPDRAVQLNVVTHSMQAVFPADMHYPLKSLVLGPCKIIPLEYPSVSCRCLDIDLPEMGGDQELSLVEELAHELLVDPQEPVVAYRQSVRYIQTFTSIPHTEDHRPAGRIKPGGVYLITGGLGGLGLEVARYLSRIPGTKLVLVGRSGLLERERWEEWLATHSEQDVCSKKIIKIQAMEQAGAEVLIRSADVTEAAQMDQLVDTIQSRFGRLDGVFHAAGNRRNYCTIAEIRPQAYQEVVAPKLTGSLNLARSLQRLKPDFMILFSSISSVLGRLGQSDYCAANAFLDAFAHTQALGSTFIQAVNWDAWKEVGLAVHVPVSPEMKSLREREIQDAITVPEGLAALIRILRLDYPQVIVSTRDLHQRLEFSRSAFGKADAALAALPSQGNIDPSSPQELQQALVSIWSRLLAVDTIAPEDNFFDLGGHSLLATRMLSQVRRQVQVEVPLQAFFETPTLAGLIYLINAIQWTRQPPNRFEVGEEQGEL